MIVVLSAFDGKLESPPQCYPDAHTISLPWYEAANSLNKDYLEPTTANSYHQLNFSAHAGKYKSFPITKMSSELYHFFHEHINKASLPKSVSISGYGELNQHYAYANYSYVEGCTITQTEIHVPIFELQYKPQPAKPLLSNEAKQLLKELYSTIIAEAEIDALSPETEQFTKPLAAKIKKLNALLQFHDNPYSEFPEKALEHLLHNLAANLFSLPPLNQPSEDVLTPEKITKIVDTILAKDK